MVFCIDTSPSFTYFRHTEFILILYWTDAGFPLQCILTASPDSKLNIYYYPGAIDANDEPVDFSDLPTDIFDISKVTLLMQTIYHSNGHGRPFHVICSMYAYIPAHVYTLLKYTRLNHYNTVHKAPNCHLNYAFLASRTTGNEK